jgi:hypothetical protein
VKKKPVKNQKPSRTHLTLLGQDTCRHFNGSWHNQCCEAGVNYRELVGGPDLGWLTRLPCHKNIEPRSGTKVPCDKFEEPTAEELELAQKEIQEAVARMEQTIPLRAMMKKKYKGVSAQETVECPVCKGKLVMTIASVNGHVWGKCKTKGCLSWME